MLVVLPVLLMISHLESATAQTVQSESSRKVINKILPNYPQIARTMNLTGVVKLEAVVTAEGKLKAVQVKGGSPLLAQSAQSALRGWKWEKLDHESTEVYEFKFMP